MAVQSLVTLSVVLLASVQIGFGLHCYYCNSDTDKSCSDPYEPNSKHLKECFIDGQCGKLIVGTPDSYFIIRDCFNPFLNCELANAVTSKMSKTETIRLCESCDGDLCNGHGRPSLALSILFTIVVLFVTNL